MYGTGIIVNHHQQDANPTNCSSTPFSLNNSVFFIMEYFLVCGVVSGGGDLISAILEREGVGGTV